MIIRHVLLLSKSIFWGGDVAEVAMFDQFLPESKPLTNFVWIVKVGRS